MVSPQNTAKAGKFSSMNISRWSLPMMTATSGFTSSNFRARAAMADWQAAWRVFHFSSVISRSK